METATLVVIPIFCLLVNFYRLCPLHTTFGQPFKELRDPFKEHKD